MDAFIARCAAEPLGRQAADDLLLRAPHSCRLARAIADLAPCLLSLQPCSLSAVADRSWADARHDRDDACWIFPGLAHAQARRSALLAPKAIGAATGPRPGPAALHRHCRALPRGQIGREAGRGARCARLSAREAQIIFALEPDDTETLAALQRLKSRAPFEIMIAPEIGPRTKPKALNAALAFATGTFTVIYDAEDRPEPDQLRRAVEAFRAEGEDVACVQARLTIDNTDDGWLAAPVHRRICRPVRPLPAGAGADGSAAAARRLVEPFPHRRAARDWRLGFLQRDRGRRSRHAARAVRLSLGRDRLDHLRRGAGRVHAVDSPAHALVQRLDANLGGAYAASARRCGAISVPPVFSRFSCSSAATCWPRSFIRCFWAHLPTSSRPAIRSWASTTITGCRCGVSLEFWSPATSSQ